MRVMREGKTIDRAVWLAKRGGACKEPDRLRSRGAEGGSIMCETHFSEMRWYSELSTTAFCEALDLRRILLQKRQSYGRSKRRPPLLEPASAEFISALAAGINSRHTLQIGCGLSTLALAAAARATNSRLWSVHHEKEKQRVVQYFLKDMGLMEYVEFITEDPSTFIPQREGVEFVLLSGLPERYIELFDLLNLKKGAIVVADNALDDTTNAYIRHVRRQPGVDSSTLPLSRGIEVTKLVTWESFKAGRKKYGGIEDPINDKEYISRRPGLQGVGASNLPLSSSSLLFSTNSDALSATSSSSRPKTLLIQLKQSNSGVLISCRESPANVSEAVVPTELESNGQEASHQDTIEEQFKSMQSLAEQWRLQLAAQDKSSGASGASAETLKAEPLEHISDEVASPSCKLSVVLPQDQAPGGVQEKSRLKMDAENNGASLPSSDGSIAERVAPEPVSSTEAPVLMEASTSGNEEPVFRVDFHIENGQTEVTVEGADQEMLLFDLTLAFNETGVSVKRAKISTQDSYVVDVFYVVDGGTKEPLLEPRWEAVRKRILDRLAERRQLLAGD